MGDLSDSLINTQAYADKRRSEIRGAADSRPFNMQKVVLDLTTARPDSNPYKISFPFNGVFVRSATDSNTTVNLAINAQDSIQIENAIGLKINDAFDLPRITPNGFLTWSAQNGKSITLYFFLDAGFRSGSQISQIAGGFTISDGDAISTLASVSIGTSVATVFSANTARKKMTIHNFGPGTVYLGSPGVTIASGANPGIPLAAGQEYEYRSTSALSAISTTAATIIGLTENS